MVMADTSIGHTFPQAPLQEQQCLSVHVQPREVQLAITELLVKDSLRAQCP